MIDEIFYSGPDREYKGIDGSNTEYKGEGPQETRILESFADEDYLRQLLAVLKAESALLLVNLTETLSYWYLDPIMAAEDDVLHQSIISEWPVDDDDIDFAVPYAFYHSLRLKNTASASYIRKTWADAMRGPFGSNAFDLSGVVREINGESSLVLGFLDEFMGDVNDSSEQRTVELLQEWAASALAGIRVFRGVYETPDEERQIGQRDLDSISQEEAKSYQAVLSARVNEYNRVLESELASFTRSFSQLSNSFYNSALGPALRFRLEASRKLYPKNSGPKAALYQISEGLDSNIRDLLVDLIRRNELFTKKVDSIASLVSTRDGLRVKLLQVAAKANMESSASIKKGAAPPVLRNWEGLVRNTVQPFSPSPLHNKLSGRNALDAHPQYLDRFGRNSIQADIRVSDGVRVDGVDISSHKHDGTDGSQRISGSDIIGLVAGSIDRTVNVEAPTNLRLVNFVPSSDGSINATISWRGDSQSVYDVNLAKIGGASLESGFSMVKRIVDLPSLSAIIKINTHDGTLFSCWILNMSSGDIQMWMVEYGSGSRLLFSMDDYIGAATLIPGPTPSVSVPHIEMAMTLDYEMDSSGNIYLPFPYVGEALGHNERYKKGFLKFNVVSGLWSYLDQDLDSEDYSTVTESICMDSRGGYIYSMGFSYDESSPYPQATKFPYFHRTRIDGAHKELILGDEEQEPLNLRPSSDFCTDGHIYAMTDDGGFAKIHPVTGVYTLTSQLPTDITNNYVTGIVALSNEILVTSASSLLSSSRFLVANKSGTMTTILDSSFFDVENPTGACKDVYGRVYCASMYTGEIYRIFETNRVGIY